MEGFTKAIQKGLDYVFTHSDEEIAEVITSYFPNTSMNDLTEITNLIINQSIKKKKEL